MFKYSVLYVIIIILLVLHFRSESGLYISVEKKNIKNILFSKLIIHTICFLLRQDTTCLKSKITPMRYVDLLLCKKHLEKISYISINKLILT